MTGCIDISLVPEGKIAESSVYRKSADSARGCRNTLPLSVAKMRPNHAANQQGPQHTAPNHQRSEERKMPDLTQSPIPKPKKKSGTPKIPAARLTGFFVRVSVLAVTRLSTTEQTPSGADLIREGGRYLATRRSPRNRPHPS